MALESSEGLSTQYPNLARLTCDLLRVPLKITIKPVYCPPNCVNLVLAFDKTMSFIRVVVSGNDRPSLFQNVDHLHGLFFRHSKRLGRSLPLDRKSTRLNSSH